MYNAETQRIRALSDNQVDAELSERADIQAILDNGLKLHGAEMAQNDQEHKHEQDRTQAGLQAQSQADAREQAAMKAKSSKSNGAS